MEKVEVKPLSVNEAWKGRRYRTDKYKDWKQNLLYLLPKSKMCFSGNLKIYVLFAFSSKASDIDNPLKPFIDTLCTKYGFNDNQIQELIVYKKVTQKNKEYIEFEIINII